MVEGDGFVDDIGGVSKLISGINTGQTAVSEFHFSDRIWPVTQILLPCQDSGGGLKRERSRSQMTMVKVWLG